MKSIKVITAIVLFTGFTSLSFAGPGIDYWTRMSQIQKDKAAIEARAAAQPVTQVASCAACSCAGMKKS